MVGVRDFCAPDSEFLFIEMGTLKFYDWLIDSHYYARP